MFTVGELTKILQVELESCAMVVYEEPFESEK
jgi:hypothetical protein